MDAILALIGVALGAILTYLFGALNARSVAAKADKERRESAGRHNASRALEIVRVARAESWKRQPDKGSAELNLDDLNLEAADAAIDLIPDAILRPQLASTLNLVRYPWALSNSSYALDSPFNTQRDGLWALERALAAYMREESTWKESSLLERLATANDKAHLEREEWEADRLAAERQKAQLLAKQRKKKADQSAAKRTAT